MTPLVPVHSVFSLVHVHMHACVSIRGHLGLETCKKTDGERGREGGQQREMKA